MEHEISFHFGGIIGYTFKLAFDPANHHRPHNIILGLSLLSPPILDPLRIPSTPPPPEPPDYSHPSRQT